MIVKLRDLLNNNISLCNSKIDELNNINNSFSNKDIYTKLREDYNNIIYLDIEEAKSILKRLDIEVTETDEIIRYLSAIKKLLEMNRDNNTSFEIALKQKKYIDLFLDKVDEFFKINEADNKNKINTYTKISNLSSKLLDDINKYKFIDKMDDLNYIFSEIDISLEDKRDILIEIIKYNEEVFKNKSNNKTKEIYVRDKLDSDLLIDLFSKYNYDFNSLDETIKNDLLVYGDLDNIQSLFKSFEEINFPRFDLKKMGRILSIILINSDSETFKRIVKYNFSKGLSLKDNLKILPALVKQTKKERVRIDSFNDSPIIYGKSDDYIKNVEFLESLGLSLNYVYSKCKVLLVISNKKLLDNYKTYSLYGFGNVEDTYGELSDNALSCLKSNHFEEVCDQFIEIDKYGYQYVKENKSILQTIWDPYDIIFYNMYASNMVEDNLGNKLIPEGPFNVASTGRVTLKSYIKRAPCSKYYNILYRDINNSNKKEKTMTIDINLENKDLFDEAIKNSNACDIVNLVEEDDLRLDRIKDYIDSSVPIRYNFNGTLISKPKVLRILNILDNYDLGNLEDSLLYSITYNSIISLDDFNKIKDIIKGRVK
jgi:hypothetical protein